MDHLGTHRNRRDGAPLTRIAVVALLALIVGAGVWTFDARLERFRHTEVR